MLEPFELSNFAPMAGEPMNDISPVEVQEWWANGSHYLLLSKHSRLRTRIKRLDTQKRFAFSLV